jgi:energy-coupling factor transport system permease protein
VIGIGPADDVRATSFLGRTSALVKLLVVVAWLLGVVATPDPRASLVMGLVGLLAAASLGSVPVRVILQGLAPLAIAACGVAFFAAVFAVGNGRPGAITVLELGPVVISVAGVEAGLLVGARLLAIGAVSIAYATTTSPTALVDSLVQQAGVSDRFAYGALAAYGALPRLAGDLRALREARALRGLRSDLHPRLLVALLVLAIRHAERLGVAMDARGFGRGRRSAYRPLAWGIRDLLVGVGGVAIVVVVVGPTLTA